MNRTAPTRYSTTQIALHWTVAALIVIQFVGHEAMATAFDDIMDGKAPDRGDLQGAWLHAIFGLTILALAAWRVWLRWRLGAPPQPHRPPPAPIRILAGTTHVALYALLFLMPISGAVAWFGGVEQAGDAHAAMRIALFGLAALHIAGAFAEQIFFKNNPFGRMAGL